MAERTTENKDEKPAEPAAPVEAASPEAQQAAVETAREGGTPQQAEQAAAAEEKQQRPELTDAEVKRVAGGLVDEMEARGLFEEAAPAVPPTAESSQSGTPAPSANGSSESGASVDEQPRKRSLFERFMGVR